MSDEVSWGLSQNHFLALSLVGFRGKRNWTLGGLQRGSAGGCCELDSGSGPGHGEQQVPTHLRGWKGSCL